MKIISFAWTTPALLAGRKRVTRREWKDAYACRFRKGDLIAAYDKSPRFGGRQVATIRLTCDPYLENTSTMPITDFEAEGFAYCEEQGLRINDIPPIVFWDAKRTARELVWVIRFEVVSYA